MCVRCRLTFWSNHGQAGLKNQIWAPKPRRAENALESTREETMQFKHVTLDFDGPVAVLRLDHQEVMNAVSMDMLGGLAEALDAIDEKKADVRCVVLTGAGRAFCTGANLQGRNKPATGRSNAGAALKTRIRPLLPPPPNPH